MEDSRIVALYWERSEHAIRESEQKYGPYCLSVARNIVTDRQTAEECVNDTWLGAWNSMPPHRPERLSAYLGKLTRRISINRWKQTRAEKRGGGQVELALEELAECLADPQTVESRLEGQALAACVNRFVEQLPPTERRVFVCRYWYLDSIAEIGERFGFSQSKVKSILYRTRQKLAACLQKEGMDL